MKDRITACMLGAAAGDAMGAPFEGKSSTQIQAMRTSFNETPADLFIEPPYDVPARGRKAGQVTDAFSIPYMLLEDVIAAGGEVSTQLACRSLIRWGDSEYFEPFAGMTTRKAVIRLNENKQLNTWDRIGHLGNKLFKGHYYALSSNGAAAKAWTAAVLSGGDETQALDMAVKIACSSHDDVKSVSGACAAASAVCCALRGGSVYDVVQAAVRGAEKGEKAADDVPGICVYPGPSVIRRLEMAIETALHVSSGADPVSEIRDRIGCGPAIAETLPAAIGIVIACKGDTMKSLIAASSIGDETATIASIAGAITGAMNGTESFPEWMMDYLDSRNGIDIAGTAAKICSLR